MNVFTLIFFLMIRIATLNVKGVQVNAIGTVDHRMVSFCIDKQDVVLGTGRWVCNNSLLKDDDCKNRIKIFWAYWQTQKNSYLNIF